MPPKKIKRILGIDFETANRHRASACCVGLVLKEFGADSILSEREILINPDCDFDKFNSLVHGIHPSHVKDAVLFPAIRDEIASIIGDDYHDLLVVAHNASFDVSVYRNECIRYNIPTSDFNYVCTYHMARALMPGQTSYALDRVSTALGYPQFAHHSALADAKACVWLFEHLMDAAGCVNATQLRRKRIVSYGRIYGDTDYDFYRPCRRYTDPADISIDVSSDNDICTDTPDNLDTNSPIYGKVFVFTGVLSGMTRAIASGLVTSHGGVVGSNITKKTNYLVYGYQDPAFLAGHDKSSKLIKAEKYIADGADLQIIDELDFLRMLDE